MSRQNLQSFLKKTEPMLSHPNLTLVAVAITEVEATAMAIKLRCRDIVFGQTLLIANYNPNPKSIITLKFPHLRILLNGC